MRKEINPTELDFLLRFPAAVNVTTPVDFLSNHSWGGIKVCIVKYCTVLVVEIPGFKIAAVCRR